MEYKKIQNKEYTLHLINSNRFKTINVVVFLTKEFNKDDITYGGMLSSNLVYTSKKYNTKNKIAIIGEELYGANITASFGISGNTESFIFSLEFLNPKYTEDKYMNDTLDFLCEVLFNPNVKDNKFDETYFNLIKKDVITKCKSVKDNPGLYASIEYAKIMYNKTPSSYSTIPNVEEVEKVTPEKLYKKYTELFNGNYKIDIAINGEIDDRIIEIIENKFKNVKGCNKKLSFKIEHTYDKKVIEKVDTLPFNQSKLYVGYRLNDLTYHELNHVLRVYNTILGTMNDSLLFNIVREENSLCYTVNSYYSVYFKALIIYAGINKDNYDKSLDLINKCIDKMGDINIVNSMIDSAIMTIDTFLNNYYDDSYSQIENKYINEFDKVDDIEVLREKLHNISSEEVVKLKDKLRLNTIYMLKGDE